MILIFYCQDRYFSLASYLSKLHGRYVGVTPVDIIIEVSVRGTNKWMDMSTVRRSSLALLLIDFSKGVVFSGMPLRVMFGYANQLLMGGVLQLHFSLTNFYKLFNISQLINISKLSKLSTYLQCDVNRNVDLNIQMLNTFY